MGKPPGVARGLSLGQVSPGAERFILQISYCVERGRSRELLGVQGRPCSPPGYYIR